MGSRTITVSTNQIVTTFIIHLIAARNKGKGTATSNF